MVRFYKTQDTLFHFYVREVRKKISLLFPIREESRKLGLVFALLSLLYNWRFKQISIIWGQIQVSFFLVLFHVLINGCDEFWQLFTMLHKILKVVYRLTISFALCFTFFSVSKMVDLQKPLTPLCYTVTKITLSFWYWKKENS